MIIAADDCVGLGTGVKPYRPPAAILLGGEEEGGGEIPDRGYCTIRSAYNRR